MKLVWLLVFLLGGAPAGAQTDYTVVFLTPGSDQDPDRAERSRLYKAHLTLLRQLRQEEKLLMAGAFEEGGGMFVMNTASTDQAYHWISADPALQAGNWIVEILPYTPRIGGVCPVPEKAAIATYTFVRFNAVVDKTTAASYPQLVRAHELFMRSRIPREQVVTEAVFGANEGGILVLRSPVGRDAFGDDPAVLQGLIHVDIQTLHLPVSSFCEEAH